jgi:hypothetical protein
MTGVDLGMKRIYIHPKYNGESAYFDVAVVLTEKVDFCDLIQPIWCQFCIFFFLITDSEDKEVRVSIVPRWFFQAGTIFLSGGNPPNQGKML